MKSIIKANSFNGLSTFFTFLPQVNWNQIIRDCILSFMGRIFSELKFQRQRRGKLPNSADFAREMSLSPKANTLIKFISLFLVHLFHRDSIDKPSYPFAIRQTRSGCSRLSTGRKFHVSKTCTCVELGIGNKLGIIWIWLIHKSLEDCKSLPISATFPVTFPWKAFLEAKAKQKHFKKINVRYARNIQKYGNIMFQQCC